VFFLFRICYIALVEHCAILLSRSSEREAGGRPPGGEESMCPRSHFSDGQGQGMLSLPCAWNPWVERVRMKVDKNSGIQKYRNT
jgi:hypothetical protein